MDVVVAEAAAADDGHALALAGDDVVRLGAGLELEVDVAGQGRGLDGAAERRLDHRDRDLRVDVVLVALEPLVGLDRDLDVEVAGRAALGAGHAAPGDPQGLAVVDAGGDVDLEGRLALDRAGARAGLARRGDHLPLALTARAGGLDGEEALAVDHLAVAAALTAGLRLGAGGRAAAVAVLAGLAALDRELALDAGHRLGERDDHAGLEVPAALRAVAAAAEPEVAEQVAEQVAEAAEDLVGTLEAGEAGARRALVPVLIVEPTLVVVAQDLERLGRLLELLLGLGIAGVAVGMPLHRGLAIGALDVWRGGRFSTPRTS
nr:hypothetical protein [Nannocystis pusilla]